MDLLVGLGNPGETYRHTRHNLGWDAVEAIARFHRFSPGSARFQGRFGDGRVAGRRVLWMLPETYMNLSGQAVGEAVRYYKLDPARVVVFHDDLDLPLGRVRIKRGGGNAGHNGLRSLQQHLGTPDFVRVRLGIGRPETGQDPAQFVLNRFSSEERRLLEPMLEALPGVVGEILDEAFAAAMNRLANPPEAGRPGSPR